jgi:hypothetical protein
MCSRLDESKQIKNLKLDNVSSFFWKKQQTAKYIICRGKCLDIVQGTYNNKWEFWFATENRLIFY